MHFRKEVKLRGYSGWRNTHYNVVKNMVNKEMLMRVIFNQSFEPLFVVSELKFQQMLKQKLVNRDQVKIG